MLEDVKNMEWNEKTGKQQDPVGSVSLNPYALEEQQELIFNTTESAFWKTIFYRLYTFRNDKIRKYNKQVCNHYLFTGGKNFYVGTQEEIKMQLFYKYGSMS